MKILARTAKQPVKASASNRSSISEALSIAQALKYVLEDMTDQEYEKCIKKCPQFYAQLQQFISSN